MIKAKTGKKVLKWIGIFLLAILLIIIVIYLLSSIPYIKHKTVSEEYKSSFDVNNYYSDTVSSERVTVIDDNNSALLSRLWMIEQAQERIILSTFDFEAGEGGKQVIASLLSAAEKGVEIEIVIDGICGFMDVERNAYFQALNSYDNVNIYLYNPVDFLKIWKLQTSLHDKYLIIDNSMYMLGGRNNTDLFLGDYSEHQNIDRDLMVFSTADSDENSIHSIVDYYYEMISLEECVKYKYNSKTKNLEEAHMELNDIYKSTVLGYFSEMPDWEGMSVACNKISLLANPMEAVNKEPTMWYALNQLMLDGSDITILTPYVICGDEMYEDLTYLCENSDSVKMIINDVNNGANPWGCVDYSSQESIVKGTGLKMYEYSGNNSLHTKTILIDDNISIVGSYNFDMRSTYLDTELMLVIDSEELNQQLAESAQETLSYCKHEASEGEVAYGENYVPHELSTLKKIAYAFLSVFIKPIRHLL